jgi:isopenicillin N synthase-like dioxygenase
MIYLVSRGIHFEVEQVLYRLKGQKISFMKIPAFDLEKLQQGIGKKELLDALENVGFIYIKNHGIPSKLIESFFNQSKEFFARDDKSKYPYSQQTNAGYLQLGQERLNGQNSKLEPKEAFNFRKDFIEEPVPKPFDQLIVQEMTRECHRTAMDLLRVYATCLSLSPDYFTERHRFDHSSGDILRCLHYPTPDPSEHIRAGGHSDFGSITLLFTEHGDTGLEIVDPNSNNFIPVPYLDDHIIVNTGDLIEYWTGSFLRSTIHRVVTRIRKPRYSVAYFCHAEGDTLLEKLESPILLNRNVSARSTKDFEDFSVVKLLGVPKTAQEHLMMRLERIHVQ